MYIAIISSILVIIGLVLEITGVYILGRRFLMKQGFSLIKKTCKIALYWITFQKEKIENETKIFLLPQLNIKTSLHDTFTGFMLILWGFIFQIISAIFSLFLSF